MVALVFVGLLVGHGNLAAAPDTTYCGAQLIVRVAKSKRPVQVNVALRIADGGTTVPVGSDRIAQTDSSGVAEFPALPVGRYIVEVWGICGTREVRKWKPPPGSPSEVYVGFDPYRRPTEVQFCKRRGYWSVMRGNCTDSLVVLVRPSRWRRVSVERIMIPR